MMDPDQLFVFMMNSFSSSTLMFILFTVSLILRDKRQINQSVNQLFNQSIAQSVQVEKGEELMTSQQVKEVLKSERISEISCYCFYNN